MKFLARYLCKLPTGKVVLWCYLIWYLVTVSFHFDPTRSIWLNSLGISAVVGVALLLSIKSGALRLIDPWQIFRSFLMPFCVSSFSSLTKGLGFVLVVSPQGVEVATAVGACALFVALVLLVKRFMPAHLRG